MDPLLEYAQRRLPAVTGFAGELVEIESPTAEKGAVDRAMEFVADFVAPAARVKRYRQKQAGDCLRIEFRTPGRRKQGQVLGMGHLDTVWPLGTLRSMPLRQAEGRLWGPGVFDMKIGVALFVFAAEALRELDIPTAKKFVVQLNSDEEVGSPCSRPYTESEARRSDAVLITEPSWGPEGMLKTARKGGGVVHIGVEGRKAHAGLEFYRGASAVIELARQLLKVAEWSGPDRGVTVNPGLIRGGTAINVVPGEASAEIDVRAPRASDLKRLTGKFERLRPFDPRTKLDVRADLRRPPMERTPGSRRLFRLARKLGRELGLDLQETTVGGGSDGNYTAALGVPTLDGLGAIGDGAHAHHEHVVIGRIPERVALVAKLIAAL